MATLKELRARISSVQGIKKITASMKMVAAARLGRQERETKAARPFLQTLVAPFDGLAPKDAKPEAQQQQLIILVTSDKGLCGSLNSNLVRPIQAAMKDETFNNRTKIASMGTKGKNGFQGGNAKNLVFHAQEFGKTPITFLETSFIAEQVFAPGGDTSKPPQYDKVRVQYNHYKNSVASEIKDVVFPTRDAFASMESAFQAYEFEGSAEEVLGDLYDFLLSGTLYGSLMENMCSELGFRMSAMDGATSNCGEVLSGLKIAYNRQRQAAITTELTEIIAGKQSADEQE